VNFIEQSCLPYLRNAQNEDGGWGFMPGAGSRVEPTAWALIALHEFASASSSEKAVSNAASFLKKVQLPDGSWPAALGQHSGSWVTSLACWSLLFSRQFESSLEKGLQWLGKELPGDSLTLWKIIRKLTAGGREAIQDDSFSGWSWTPGTASWVEPTSYAIIALRKGTKSPPPKLNQRLHMAKSMLYDRMCPAGGWNCGNPMVYGVAGEPQVGPTVWALLALQEDFAKPKIQESLNWLEHNAAGLQSPGSLALTHIALHLAGRTYAAAKLLPRIYDEKNEVLWNVPVAAWSALTATKHNWLSVTLPNGGTR